VRTLVEEIPPGNAGVYLTLARMRVLSQPTPRVRETVWRILRDVPADASFFVRAAVIYDWVVRHMRYVDDLAGHEELWEADRLLHQIEDQGHGAGDCDDYVILLAALYRALGLSCWFVVVSAAPTGEYDHVYLKVLTERGLVNADGIHGAPFGWEVPPEAVTAQELVPV
jgi:transglutaminase-like putative cysteine protease